MRVAGCLSTVCAGVSLVLLVGSCADTGDIERHAADPEGRAIAIDRNFADQVRARLTSLRAVGGREPAVPFAAAETHLRGARKRLVAGDDPREVLDDLLQLAANDSERDIAFWYEHAPELEQIQFPRKLLQSRHLSLGIVVIHSLRQNPPEYQVLFAMAEPDQSN